MTSKASTFLKVSAATCASVVLLRWFVRKSCHFSYSGKRILVTGGSRGLGLVLARKLVMEGARVAICARDEGELHRAVKQLRDLGGEVLGIQCDVREKDQVQAAVKQLTDAWRSIDILFNVAGIIHVGPFDSMTKDDFLDSMQTNCWGPLQVIQEVLPFMRKQRWGRIVNVASLGGKRAVPHMIPYDTSKFALVGLSTGLRTELVRDGILVTTVCPGLIRTGSPRHAIFKGQNRKEFAWFSIGDSLPLLSMPAEKAALKIMQACQRGDSEAVISGAGQVAASLQKIFPNLSAEALTAANQLLPQMGGIGTRSALGSESSSWLSPSLLTTLGDAAAARNNEVEPL